LNGVVGMLNVELSKGRSSRFHDFWQHSQEPALRILRASGAIFHRNTSSHKTSGNMKNARRPVVLECTAGKRAKKEFRT
jgi:hypothetical protein